MDGSGLRSTTMKTEPTPRSAGHRPTERPGPKSASKGTGRTVTAIPKDLLNLQFMVTVAFGCSTGSAQAVGHECTTGKP